MGRGLGTEGLRGSHCPVCGVGSRAGAPLEWFERVLKAPMLAYASALALMFFCIAIFGVIDASIPFVYFQF